MSWITRRSFLKMALPAAAGVGIGTSVLYRYGKNLLRDQSASEPKTIFPIAPISASEIQKNFSGDHPKRAHSALWNKADYLRAKKGLPNPTEKTAVAVVGGGVAGLSAAYLLRQYQPILFEQDQQFGGNSKGELWDDLPYSIGAAYFVPPEEGSHPYKFLEELDLLQHRRREKKGEGHEVIVDSKMRSGFWNGSTDPSRAQEFKKFISTFKKIQAGPYPDIPVTPTGMSAKKMHSLDEMTFAQWLRKEFGESLHPHIEEFVQDYCWSSFGGGIEEISAAQGLNFLTSDLFEVNALPGGNAAITQRLTQKLLLALPKKNLRTQSLVVDIRLHPEGVQISYEDADGNFRSIVSKVCVVCCPKFVARYLIDQLPDDQMKAIQELKYRAYIVANIFLKSPSPSPGYDLYRLTGENWKDSQRGSLERPYTDVVFASWAGSDTSKHSVLTLYKPYPFEGGRAMLFEPSAFERIKTQIENSLEGLLASVEMNSNSVANIRLTRWGHPIPLAAPGLLSRGVLERAARTLNRRIFFAQQDNWANPCFETALESAFHAAGAIQKIGNL